MRYFIYQVNPKLGDLVGNYSKIKDEFLKQKDKVDIFILPELVISGYPPEDLLLADYFLDKLIKLQEDLIKLTKGANSSLIFGGVEREGGNLYNSAFVASKGKIVDIVRKSNLPNYGVFDEKRYFVEGDDELKILEISGVKTLLLICEDFWQENLLTEIAKLKFDLIITINASPYEDNKFTKKLDIAKKLVKKSKKELIYVNMVGGQDSLVFDGRSFVVGSNSEIIKILDGFQEAKFLYDGKELKSQQYSYSFSSESYLALVLGLRDYVFKNGFDEVVLGLSGGIDSAFVACLACDALGSDKVNLVMMPSQYTSTESIKDAEDIAAALGCSNLLNIGIEKIYEESIRSLKKSFKGKGADLTEENLQARIRGNIIMALANKHNYLALATSNKSESAVGYATLYGDMCGGYSAIKDIYKTDLYKIAKWRNANIPKNSKNKVQNIFSKNILTKEPTAELRHNQKDSDSLPEYPVLDKILKMFLEKRFSSLRIADNGFDKKLVEKIEGLILRSEYKRRQAAIGPKISNLSFDKDRRIPITNGFKSNG